MTSQKRRWALDQFLDKPKKEKINRQFEAMAKDTTYQELNKAIAEEFAESDWEALMKVEKEEIL